MNSNPSDSVISVSNYAKELNVVNEETNARNGNSFTPPKRCKKEHGEYMGINQFSLNHLPEECRDEKVFELMKGISDLTVKVTVNKISPMRPDFYPDTTIPYPFKDISPAERVTNVGTGRVHDIRIHNSRCPCRKCKLSKKPSYRCAEVEVVTAMHVVYDDFEARESFCRLFYDGPDSHEVVLGGLRVTNAHVKEDRCTLLCITCDCELIEQLHKKSESTWLMYMQINQKFKNVGSRFVFIVSHPHGKPKQVALGKWIQREPVDQLDKTQYMYTTCTCPGSSGAYVWILGSLGWYNGHIHSCADKENNISSHGLDFLPTP